MNLPLLDPQAKDWIQALSWLAAAVAAVVGVLKVLFEMRQNRAQREQELRWRKAQAAKALNDEMLEDRPSLAAMTMLDWDGREFEVKPGQVVAIDTTDMIYALRVREKSFSDTEAFVRDAFDNLFYFLGLFEHSISRELVDFEDLVHPIEYYVQLMARHRPALDDYLTAYGFTRAASFLRRFESWRRVEGLAHTAQPTPGPQRSRPVRHVYPRPGTPE